MPQFENMAYFDVDNTLILHQPLGHNCPDCHALHDSKVHVNDSHVAAIKNHVLRGDVVVVWSARGSWWAEAAVKFLGLESHVAMTLSKPSWLYDDLEPSEWLPRRIFMDPPKR